MVKYMVRARVEVDGVVDKHDIIGAIFGQTEGLFGSEFDLRDLQDKGRIGRISVDVKQQGSKTVGEILLPSNLDRVETALVAAMLEFVDKVGPFNARVKVIDIVDVRREKIKKIVERAKEIMLSIREKEIDIKEVLQEIESSVRTAEIITYGPERLPAGPDIDTSDTIIIVEGRADVLNLLRYGYRNVIALEGAKGEIPETIIKLSKSKKTIVFLDGDRAGDMILKELMRVAKIDYVARAPPGREVEELTGKEIAKALKNAVPLETYLQQITREAKEKVEGVGPQPATPVPEAEAVSEFVIPEPVIKAIESLKGSLESIIYDKDWKEVLRIPVKDLVDRLVSDEIRDAHAILMDGVITQRLVDIASAKGINILVGSRLGALSKKPTNLTIMTFDDVKS